MKTLRWAALAASLTLISAPALANSGDPAAAYCNDLNTAVQEKMNASMQRRMPSSMPGEFMNDVFGVQEIIDTRIDFGLPGPSSLFDALFSFAKSKIQAGKSALLGEVNNALSDLTRNTGINLNAQSGTFSAGAIQYTPTLNGSTPYVAPSEVAQPLSGAPVYASPASSNTSPAATNTGSWATDFFKKLF